jgi:hypothetical protein
MTLSAADAWAVSAMGGRDKPGRGRRVGRERPTAVGRMKSARPARQERLSPRRAGRRIASALRVFQYRVWLCSSLFINVNARAQQFSHVYHFLLDFPCAPVYTSHRSPAPERRSVDTARTAAGECGERKLRSFPFGARRFRPVRGRTPAGSLRETRRRRPGRQQNAADAGRFNPEERSCQKIKRGVPRPLSFYPPRSEERRNPRSFAQGGLNSVPARSVSGFRADAIRRARSAHAPAPAARRKAADCIRPTGATPAAHLVGSPRRGAPRAGKIAVQAIGLVKEIVGFIA